MRRRLATVFLATVFLLSWGGGLALRAALWLRGEAWTAMNALVFFPFLILSVAVTAVGLTAQTDGRDGLRRLWRRQLAWRVGRWYGVVLLPPALILLTLLLLRVCVGSAFQPNFFPLGFAFGIPAGVLEEIGWTGFALPALAPETGRAKGSVLLGVLWGLWHLPVVDSLGAASPHLQWFPAFAAAFVLALSRLRVIIAWAAASSRSLLMAQLIHISSTGSLVMLGPTRVTPAQEALWYAAYGIALWVVAALILTRGDPIPERFETGESALSRLDRAQALNSRRGKLRSCTRSCARRDHLARFIGPSDRFFCGNTASRCPDPDFCV